MRTLLLVVGLVFSTLSFAQKNAPGWLDPVKRANKYNDDVYLTALSMETLGKKAKLVKKYELLNAAARDQIMQSVIVSINSQTEMNISVQNTQTDESIQRKSVSFTVGDLVGLKVENYYDEKKRIAYAFAYVLIDDLKKYYLDVITTQSELVDSNAGKIHSLPVRGTK